MSRCLRCIIFLGTIAFIPELLQGQTIIHQNSAIVQVSTGLYDFRRPSVTSELQVEVFFPLKLNIIRPMAGILATGTRDVYASVGAGIPVSLSGNFVLLPSIGGGIYKHGNGTELGYAMEFCSDLEITYELANHSYIGVGIYHFSNGSLSKTNPGLESLLLSYSFLL
jgi:hypothetical protein